MRDQRTLSPLASALTRFAPASPLDSALTKNIPGGGGAPCDPLLSTLTLDFQLFSVNSFRLIHFRKNASANPLVSHTFKTKDLKPFRFIHFQKKGGWLGPGHRCPARKRGVRVSDFQLLTSDLRSSLTPLTSTLTKNASATPLTSTLTKKGVGQGPNSSFVFRVPAFTWP